METKPVMIRFGLHPSIKPVRTSDKQLSNGLNIGLALTSVKCSKLNQEHFFSNLLRKIKDKNIKNIKNIPCGNDVMKASSFLSSSCSWCEGSHHQHHHHHQTPKYAPFFFLFCTKVISKIYIYKKDNSNRDKKYTW